MAETLFTLSIISFVIAGVCFAIAVFFWFFFKIPVIISDLSGRTAKKSIAILRAENEKNNQSKNKTVRKKGTGLISEKLKKQENDSLLRPETGLLDENKVVSYENTETGLLEYGTELLDSEQTGLLEDDMATAPHEVKQSQVKRRKDGKELEIIEEIMMIHTDETI